MNDITEQIAQQNNNKTGTAPTDNMLAVTPESAESIAILGNIQGT
jgi:hypothetical protein